MGELERAMHHYQRAFKLDTARHACLDAGRALYRRMGNLEMVARLYDIQIKVAAGPLEAARLLLAKGEVLLSELDDPARALEAWSRACALALAARGARVLVNNRRHPGENDEQTSAGQVVAAIRAAGGTAQANFESVQSEGAGVRMVAHALEHFGCVDILVANAASPQAATFRKQTLEEFRAIFDVGFLGALQLVHAAWPHLLDRGWGRVIMMTSSAGRYGNHGLAAYSASKAAIEMLMRSLAAEGASR